MRRSPRPTFGLLASFLFVLAAFGASRAACRAWTITFKAYVVTGTPSYEATPYTGLAEYYSTNCKIELLCDDPNAVIRYTTDGSAPSATSPIYTQQIPVVRKITLWAKAFNASSAVPDFKEEFHATGMIAAGGAHALALPHTGASVFGWGFNAQRQVGNNSPLSTTDQGVGQIVTDSTGVALTGVKMVAGGMRHSLALLNDGTIRAWGEFADGQLGNNSNVLAGVSADNYLAWVRGPTGAAATKLQGVTHIAAGLGFSLAVAHDGSTPGKLWAWGSNDSSQLGQGNGAGWAADRLFPVPVLKPDTTALTGITEVSGGAEHAVALGADGTVYAWGSNANGKVLGSSATTAIVYYATAVTSFGDASNPAIARAVAAGLNHTLVIRNSDGSVWGWGSNTTGQLGCGAAAATQRIPQAVVKNSPVDEPLTNVVQVKGGATHSIAVTENGDVYTWGDNTYGQLGVGDVTQRNRAKQIPATAFESKVVAVAAGNYYSMALTENGTLYTWGNRAAGRLWNGSTAAGTVLTPSTSATRPELANAPSLAGVSASISGTVSPATVTFTGTARDNDPNATISVRRNGVLLPESTAITSSDTFTLAIPNQLPGTHSYEVLLRDSSGLAAVAGPFAYTISPPTVTLAAPSTANVSEGEAGTVSNMSIQLGAAQPGTLRVNFSYGTGTNAPIRNQDYTAPSSVDIPSGTLTASLPITILQDRVRDEPNEVLTVAVSSLEWVPGRAQHFYGATRPTASITIYNVNPAKTPVISPTPQFARTDYVRLSDGTSSHVRYTIDGSDPTPSSPACPSGTFLRVAHGTTVKAQCFVGGQPPSDKSTWVSTGKAYAAACQDHAFAVSASGVVWAWGKNASGELGFGDANPRAYPGIVSWLSDPKAIAGRTGLTVAVKSDGTVVSWGAWASGLGNGTHGYSLTPVDVAGMTGATSVAASDSHVVILKADGSIWSWGQNARGALGDGTTTGRTTPVQAKVNTATPLGAVIAIAAGIDFTVALKSDGTVWTMGRSDRLGTNASTDSVYAVQVPSISQAVAISAGAHHAWALVGNASLRAWGDNSKRQAAPADGADALLLQPLPVLIGDLYNRFAFGAAGDAHSAAIDSGGNVHPAGLAQNAAADRLGGRRIISASAREITIVVEDTFHDAAFWSWGPNAHGQLGRLSTAPIDRVRIDTDGDGLLDTDELRYDTSVNLTDSNGDGLSDYENVLTGTNPAASDVDGDGVSNSVERARGTDPFTANIDASLPGPPIVNIITPPAP